MWGLFLLLATASRVDGLHPECGQCGSIGGFLSSGGDTWSVGQGQSATFECCCSQFIWPKSCTKSIRCGGSAISHMFRPTAAVEWVQGYTCEEVREVQLEEPDLELVHIWLRDGHKPSRERAASLSPVARCYWLNLKPHSGWRGCMSPLGRSFWGSVGGYKASDATQSQGACFGFLPQLPVWCPSWSSEDHQPD